MTVTSALPTRYSLVFPTYARCGAFATDYLVAASDDVVIDMRGVEWTDPVGLVTVAAHAQHESQRGPIRFLAPGEPNVARYLARMGLAAMLDELDVTHDLPGVQAYPVTTLVELRRFDGTSGATDIAEKVFHTLKNSDLEVAKSLYQAICELGTNVPEHAGRPDGFVAAQVVPRGNVVRFAVGDAGAGLRAKLSVAGATDDLEAARLALTKGVTDTGVVHRGKGLAAVRRLVVATGGALHVASGKAALTVTRNGEAARWVNVRFRGTVIQGQLPCSLPL